MELLLIVVSLVIQIGSTEGTCRCLDQTLCGDPGSGCNYRCQPGFTGKNCQHDNLGYMSARSAKELFDGDYSTCLRLVTGTKINFTQPIDIDTIRVHRIHNRLGKFFPFVYINKRTVSLWRNNYQFRAEGPAAAAHFPVQTGVTAIKIDNMRIVCEVELTNANECSKGFYGNGCTQRCAAGCEDRECNNVEGACVCKPGWRGGKCSERCSRNYYGSGCTHRCADGCVGRDCDQVDGSCICKLGWMGDKCSENCPSGYYGPGCADSCSEGCYIGTCHHVSGNCSCKDGWIGEKCSEQCPSGFYGPGCADSCNEGCKRGTCHHVNGNCDCKDGWTGEKCSEQKENS